MDDESARVFLPELSSRGQTPCIKGEYCTHPYTFHLNEEGSHIMEPARFPAMTATLQIRKEVHEFVQAAEFLLSPALQTPALTDDECVIIAEYVTTLSHAKQPWGKSLVIRYA